MGVMGLKKEIVLYAPLVPSQLELYKSVCSSDLTKEVLTETNSKFIFTVIMQLRKVASIPLLFTREDAAVDDDMKLWNISGLPSAHDLILQSGKLRLFVELMRLLAKEGRKVLVFSQYTRILDVLQLCMRSLADPTLLGSEDKITPEIHPTFAALDKVKRSEDWAAANAAKNPFALWQIIEEVHAGGLHTGTHPSIFLFKEMDFYSAGSNQGKS
jgi:hypothetical protein